MKDDIKSKETAHIDPALEVLDLIGEQLDPKKNAVPVSELWAKRKDLSSGDLTDGMRMLIEKGVVKFKGGDTGPELSVSDDASEEDADNGEPREDD